MPDQTPKLRTARECVGDIGTDGPLDESPKFDVAHETPDGRRIFAHTCGTSHDDGECMACGQIDCPDGEPLHYHHDGCPCCSQRPQTQPSRGWEQIHAFLDAIDEIVTIGTAPAVPGGQHTRPPAYRMTPSTGQTIKWNTRELRSLLAQQATQIAEQDKEIKQLKAVIAWANNSLYGSHGFFLATDGGASDEHHLDRPIEDLKQRSNLLTNEVAALSAQVTEQAKEVAKLKKTHADEMEEQWVKLSAEAIEAENDRDELTQKVSALLAQVEQQQKDLDAIRAAAAAERDDWRAQVEEIQFQKQAREDYWLDKWGTEFKRAEHLSAQVERLEQERKKVLSLFYWEEFEKAKAQRDALRQQVASIRAVYDNSGEGDPVDAIAYQMYALASTSQAGEKSDKSDGGKLEA